MNNKIPKILDILISICISKICLYLFVFNIKIWAYKWLLYLVLNIFIANDLFGELLSKNWKCIQVHHVKVGVCHENFNSD